MKSKSWFKHCPICWIIMGLFMLTVGIITVAGHLLHLRINTTPSMPEGLWQVLPVNVNKLNRGDIVLICPPKTQLFEMAYQRGYISRGNCPSGYEPLLKRIIALPGDSVQVSESGLSVNGQSIPNSRPIKRDVYGKPLPQLAYGTYSIYQGSMWVLANTNPASFDGRYWGTLTMAYVVGVAKPVLVYRTNTH
jgi:conjugative transfer signal peptidase TraF